MKAARCTLRSNDDGGRDYGIGIVSYSHGFSWSAAAAAGSIKQRLGERKVHRRNVLFLSRRNKIFFERSKNNIDLQ